MVNSASASGILGAIGNTPCVQLQHVVPAGYARVFLKMESLNPTGSYKDRMARAMIEEAARRGDLRKGMTVVEATGGSTGSSLAFICAAQGYKFRAICSESFAAEKLRTISAFGGDLELMGSKAEGITPTLMPAMRARAEELSASGDYYATSQFTNADILLGFKGLGLELLESFPHGIDAFCGAVGTAGMMMGVSRILKPKMPDIKIVVLEPESAPLISQQRAGSHRIDGIAPGFVPPLLDRKYYDEVRTVAEEDARNMCRRLAREEGILVGTSTGLNVMAAIELAKELGPDKTVVTVACDTGLKYLSGDLFAASE